MRSCYLCVGGGNAKDYRSAAKQRYEMRSEFSPDPCFRSQTSLPYSVPQSLIGLNQMSDEDNAYLV